MANGKADYYDLLGISKSSTADEIKKAYRRQALEWHPDKHKDNKEAAEKRFKEINEAYQVLSDPQKRQAYDQFGHTAFSPGGGSARGQSPFGGQPFGSSRGGPFSYTYTSGQGGVPFDFSDPFEIFEQFFGGGSPFRQAQTPRYSIDINFMEAVNGVEKEVSIEGRKRTIKIPAGVDDGSRIRFSEFILSINVKPHPDFERDGADVYSRLPIPFSLAALGGEVEVPTVNEVVKIKIRAGTPSGTMIRLKERGIKKLQGRGKGDHYVKLQIEVPQKLSRGQKMIIEELRKGGL